MGTSSDLRRELKSRFIPWATARGFSVDTRLQPRSTIFRRRTSSRVELFEVQWDKYGTPRFVVRFGTCPPAGLQVNADVFPAEETLPTWCDDSGSLQPGRGFSTRSWFRQDSTLVQRLLRQPARRPADVVDELLALFPEVERYWATGAVGPHIQIQRGRRRLG
jgi:hypothetical protein